MRTEGLRGAPEAGGDRLFELQQRRAPLDALAAEVKAAKGNPEK